MPAFDSSIIKWLILKTLMNYNNTQLVIDLILHDE